MAQISISNPLGARKDALEGFQFYLQIDQKDVGYFTEMSGLQAEVQVEDYFEGGLNDRVHKLPGRAKFGNVTLRRGVFNGGELWKWLNQVLAGTISRKNVTVVLKNRGGAEKFRWTLLSAFPMKWSAPQLRAGDNAVAVESLEFACEGLELLYIESDPADAELE